MRLSKITALILACCMASGGLAGCSNNGGTANQGAANSSPSSESGAEVISAAEVTGSLANLEDGVLDIGSIRYWDTLTPFCTNLGNDAPFIPQLYEALAKLNFEKEYVPQVAKSWTAEPDGINFNIEIFDYVTDSAGNKITAADIVWMIEESKKVALKPAFAKVESVEQTGDYTLKVTMKKDVFGAFEAILTNTYVVSKAAYEGSKDQFATEVISTSPYQMTKFIPGSILSIEKRSEYWQKPELIDQINAAGVDKVSYHVIAEASQAGIALESGEIDGFISLDPNTAKQFEGNKKFSMLKTSYINGNQIFFSGAPNSLVAEDPFLRQAICHAIDTEGLITGVFAGYGKSMGDTASDLCVGFLEKWKQEEYLTYDVEKAKELLAQSNYNGEELILLGGSNSTTKRLCEMLQAYLLQVGIKVKLNLVDPALFQATRLDGTQYDMVTLTAGGETLPDHWAMRFDSQAYKTGDATSRHDTALDELLYKTWTRDGFTEENIDEVHRYIKENTYAYGMVQPENIDIWRSDIGLSGPIRTFRGSVDFATSVYSQ